MDTSDRSSHASAPKIARRPVAIAPFAFTALLIACAAPGDPSSLPEREAPLWQFEAAAPDLMSASCPDDRPFSRADAFDITVTPVDLSTVASEHSLIGWELSSEKGDFGGLSGLAVMASGTLLAITDKGAFIWLAMEDGVPTGRAHYAKMLDQDGAPLEGKIRGDAEGLALRDGLALVSFEHTHRILAFDLEGCGATPLGREVAAVPERPKGMSRSMRRNGGMEGLALLPNGQLATAIETRDPAIPYGRLRSDGTLIIDGRISTFNAKAGTGMDIVGDTLFTVHRDYRLGDGNYISVSQTALAGGVPSGPATPILTLDPSQPVDNFEAIAAVTDDADLATRLYLLSDDNFNSSQRTLLFAIDLKSR